MACKPCGTMVALPDAFKTTKRLQFQHDQFEPITSGYGSLKWSDTFKFVPLSKAQEWDKNESTHYVEIFNPGQNSIAYNGSGNTVSVSSNTDGQLFGLKSFEAATPEADQGLFLLKGSRNGVEIYSEIFKIVRERQIIRLNWIGIDTLKFVPQQGGKEKYIAFTEMTVAVQ